MEIRTLERIKLDALCDCFNLAFSDYVVPLQMTTEQLERKFKLARVELSLSFCAVDNDQLVAFVLHGVDWIENKKTLFNAGTGVIPTYRGQRLVEKIYQFAQPHMLKNQVQHYQLEVIQSNQKAIRAYQKVGYQITRELVCFKGEIKQTQVLADLSIVIEQRPIPTLPFKELAAYVDCNPAWEQSFAAIKQNPEGLTAFVVRVNDQLAGYLIVHKGKGSIVQFAVDPQQRKQGLATRLFNELSKHSATVSIVNVDKRATAVIEFLTKIGLEPFVEQYKMELEV
ncbi:Ribosomal protein S18 acetylase RimI [Amphibacillus marinus]|uniref:Ribosomal protein S18 acetylase RimI n=1 Tax=Amphibacillus marinus TaxID=872970 RepID=A0A1H8LR87_9BACI|nr:GNAT family N-acetyltransferase [Amphibacillus marinus]SEO07631.1 Ribosomal protein S18 acetylase RimI [Amphibacillus marinus]